MDQRKSDLQQQDPRRQGPSDEDRDQSSGESRAMTDQGASGNMSGYVVPYRYYGPGYRGVGYYAVFYQGSEPGDAADQGQGYGQQGQGYGQQGQGYGQQGPHRTQGHSYGDAWTSGRTGFAGRGPKNYQRSDERIREEINDRLTADDSLDASDIEVQVRQGEVTLSGTVPERWSKRHAEDIADEVSGVREVMNQLRLASDHGGSTSGQTTKAGTSGQKSTATSGDRSYQEATTPNGRRSSASSR